MIRVLVAAASTAGLAGLEALVAANASLELAGRSRSLASLARTLEDVEADVVLAETDGQNGDVLSELQAVLRNRGESRLPAIVLLTGAEDARMLTDWIHSGISAVLPLEATASEVGGGIQAAAAGLLVLHPAFADSLPEARSAPRPRPDVTGPSLTPREVEVLNLIAQGLGNKEIAWRLGISEHTVKFHIGSIFNKLDASGRTEAVTLGIRAGLIML